MTLENPFQTLRPYCLKVSENPSVDSMNILKKELGKYSFEQLQPLQKYILFPIKMAFLREKRKENETISAVNCLELLLSLTEVQDWKLFTDLYNDLLMFISYLDKEIKVMNGKEDLKVSVVSCLKMLLEHSHKSVKNLIYDSSFCPVLAHGVLVLLHLAEHEQLRSLKILSMKTLMVLFGLTTCTLGDSTQHAAYDRLAFFLPGICIALTKVATADEKQGQAALETWASVVANCLNIPQEQQDDQKEKVVEIQQKTFDICRTRDWIASSASKLQVLLQRFLSLVSHPHYKVRLALVDWARMLLLYCSSPFQDSLIRLLECVISLTQDESEVVASKSREVITSFCEQELSRPLIDTLEDSVYALATRLPRLLQSSDEKEKLVSLNLLAGYFALLGDRIGSFLHSSPHLKRLSQSLLHVAELDSKHVPLVMPPLGTPSSGCLEFQHFRDKSILTSLKKVCHILGLNGDLCLLVDCFLEVAQKNVGYRESAIFLINLIVAGAALKEKDKPELVETIRYLLQVYQNSWLWDNEKTYVLKGLLLEGLAAFAQIIGQEVDLQDLLCLLLEQAGSNSLWVAHSGQTALHSLASSCFYRSIEDMISSNADYLLHNISLKLLHFNEYPDLPGLLNVLFGSCSEEVIILFEDVICQILTTVDACYKDSKGLPYLSVLRNLLNTIQKWPSSKEDKKKNEDNLCAPESSASLKNFLLQHHSNYQASQCPEINHIDEEFHLENYISLPEDEETKPTKSKPPRLKITSQVMEHCSHYMRSRDVQTILVSLDIVQLGLSVLCQNEDELLQKVHKLWSPFKDLFKNSNPLILSKAFEALLQMSTLCKTFIHKRTLDDIWPSLLSYLRNVLKNGSERHYASQNSYKLQLLLLSKLGELAVQLDFQEKPLNNICQMCLRYLETEQSVDIKKACVSTLSVVKQLDSDAVWWWLTRSSGLSSNFPRYPGKEFRLVHLPKVNRHTEVSLSMISTLLENDKTCEWG